MINVIKKANDWKKNKKDVLNGYSIGFVPTMGTLHEGHLSLIERSKKNNDITVVSIFVNPTQFNDKSDFENYPKTFDHDFKNLNTLKVDYLFYPSYDELYKDNFRYVISEKDFSTKLCGTSRPGHFDGVLTVVMKLLNIIKADRAYFGEKDYQQLSLIKGMADVFFIDTEIISCPTIRDVDGLALSSRNLLLTREERSIAPKFYKLLKSGKNVDIIKSGLTTAGFKIDYIEEFEKRIFGAVFLGNVRLIDNVKK